MLSGLVGIRCCLMVGFLRRLPLVGDGVRTGDPDLVVGPDSLSLPTTLFVRIIPTDATRVGFLRFAPFVASLVTDNGRINFASPSQKLFIQMSVRQYMYDSGVAGGSLLSSWSIHGT